MVRAACDARETGQPIAAHGGAGAQRFTRPGGDRLARKARQLRKFGPQRMALLIHRDRREEGHLVRRAAPDGPVAQLPAEVGIVELDRPRQPVAGLALHHGLHQLVVHEPGGGIAHPQSALQGQGRETALGLADEVHGQKPHRQRQLGALEQGAGDQRGLMMAAVALKGLAGLDPQHAVGRPTTARAAKAVRPTRLLQRRLALRLGTTRLKQLKQRLP